jgi:hypothetical protein
VQQSEINCESHPIVVHSAIEQNMDQKCSNMAHMTNNYFSSSAARQNSKQHFNHFIAFSAFIAFIAFIEFIEFIEFIAFILHHDDYSGSARYQNHLQIHFFCAKASGPIIY